MLDGEAIDRLLAFLPAFERGDLASADAHYRATGQYPSEILSLTKSIYDAGLVQREFNWVAWKGEGRRFALDTSLVAQADLDTFQKLLTLSVRQDRFVGGLMPSLCSSGLIQAILNRLAVLHNEATGGPAA